MRLKLKRLSHNGDSLEGDAGVWCKSLLFHSSARVCHVSQQILLTTLTEDLHLSHKKTNVGRKVLPESHLERLAILKNTLITFQIL